MIIAVEGHVFKRARTHVVHVFLWDNQIENALAFFKFVKKYLYETRIFVWSIECGVNWIYPTDTSAEKIKNAQQTILWFNVE